MKRFFSSPVAAALALAVPTLLFSWYVATREVSLRLVDVDPADRRSRTQMIGGVERPLSDITSVSARSGSSRGKSTGSGDNTPVNYHFGPVTCPHVPILSAGQNPQMDSVIEAIKGRTHPERLSPLHESVPFDVRAWKADPKTYRWQGDGQVQQARKSDVHLVAVQEQGPSYLETAEPGRIYDVAAPGEGVPVLTNASESAFRIRDGEAVRLGVRTLPQAPVTFTSFGVGKFENGLTTLTAAADEQGVATAVYTTSTGTNTHYILAGSPLATGNVQFIVDRERYFAPQSN